MTTTKVSQIFEIVDKKNIDFEYFIMGGEDLKILSPLVLDTAQISNKIHAKSSHAKWFWGWFWNFGTVGAATLGNALGLVSGTVAGLISLLLSPITIPIAWFFDFLLEKNSSIFRSGAIYSQASFGRAFGYPGLLLGRISQGIGLAIFGTIGVIGALFFGIFTGWGYTVYNEGAASELLSNRNEVTSLDEVTISNFDTRMVSMRHYDTDEDGFVTLRTAHLANLDSDQNPFNGGGVGENFQDLVAFQAPPVADTGGRIVDPSKGRVTGAKLPGEKGNIARRAILFLHLSKFASAETLKHGADNIPAGEVQRFCGEHGTEIVNTLARLKVDDITPRHRMVPVGQR